MTTPCGIIDRHILLTVAVPGDKRIWGFLEAFAEQFAFGSDEEIGMGKQRRFPETITDDVRVQGGKLLTFSMMPEEVDAFEDFVGSYVF